MAGGFKQFGPTYNTTPYVRLGYEGTLNGAHPIDVAAAQAVNGELAGRFASISGSGVGVAGAGGANAVGLFREDLGDMQNASAKATFYFRGGEYYVAAERTGLSKNSVLFSDTARNVGTFVDVNPGADGVQAGIDWPGAKQKYTVTFSGTAVAGNVTLPKVGTGSVTYAIDGADANALATDFVTKVNSGSDYTATIGAGNVVTVEAKSFGAVSTTSTSAPTGVTIVSTTTGASPSTTGLDAGDIVFNVGDEITCDAQGRIVPKAAISGSKALGIVTHLGEYPAGNMYANAGAIANAGDFVGFILYI